MPIFTNREEYTIFIIFWSIPGGSPTETFSCSLIGGFSNLRFESMARLDDWMIYWSDRSTKNGEVWIGGCRWHLDSNLRLVDLCTKNIKNSHSLDMLLWTLAARLRSAVPVTSEEMREHNLGFFVSTISFAKTGERDGTSRNFATLPTHFQGDAQNADNLSYARTAHYKDVSYKFIKKFVPSSESEGCCGSAGIRGPGASVARCSCGPSHFSQEQSVLRSEVNNLE